MIICDICTGRHLTACCVIARPFVAQCFEGTVDDYVIPTATIFEQRRQQRINERAAWEAERDARRKANATERSRRSRARLRLVS